MYIIPFSKEEVITVELEAFLDIKAQKGFGGCEHVGFTQCAVDQELLKKAINNYTRSGSRDTEIWVYLGKVPPLPMRILMFSQEGAKQRVVLQGVYQPADSNLATARLALAIGRHDSGQKFKPIGNKIFVCSPHNKLSELEEVFAD